MAVSCVEFADALLTRAQKNKGKLSDFTIVIKACYGADFIVNVINQLAPAYRAGIIQDYPRIISYTNRGVTVYLRALGIQNMKQKTISGKDFMGLEKDTWKEQDMSFFLQMTPAELQTLQKELNTPKDTPILP